MKKAKTSEKIECHDCGEMIPITRDIKGQIVSEDCPYCPRKAEINKRMTSNGHAGRNTIKN
jgi:formylmethanofuran dehydrogenase subunit E